ncbi:hypothetical protein TNCV_2902591 [Trichonephila clavipes]|nr:hypothetical protein TNCV_2902591 [Trichonephila clavipes]
MTSAKGLASTKKRITNGGRKGVGTNAEQQQAPESIIDLVFGYYMHHRAVLLKRPMTATAGSDVVQSGRPIFDDFFQQLWPYICNNTANVVFQMVKRLWLIRIDQ